MISRFTGYFLAAALSMGSTNILLARADEAACRANGGTPSVGPNGGACIYQLSTDSYLYDFYSDNLRLSNAVFANLQLNACSHGSTSSGVLAPQLVPGTNYYQTQVKVTCKSGAQGQEESDPEADFASKGAASAQSVGDSSIEPPSEIKFGGGERSGILSPRDPQSGFLGLADGPTPGTN